jgi:flagellar hook-associated protein 3 FlgL
MLQGVDGASEKFLADLKRIQDATEAASQQITSGLRVQRPSDDPASVADILQLRAGIGWNSQVLANLDSLKTESDTAQEALAQAVQLIDQARTLGSQGTSPTVTDQARQSLAEQVRGILEQLVSISRTTCDGRFIFSGDLDSAPVFELNVTSPNGVNQLASPSATRQVEDADGTALPGTLTAQDIFDSPQASVFAALKDLLDALQNNSQTDIQTALDSLESAGDHVNTQLSHYGYLQTRVSAAIDRGQKVGLSRQTELSDRSDADLTAATLALNQGQLHEQAAFLARSRVATASLFDYLA